MPSHRPYYRAGARRSWAQRSEFMRGHLEGTETQKQRAYSPAVVTQGGRIVWLAGHTATQDDEGRDISYDFARCPCKGGRCYSYPPYRDIAWILGKPVLHNVLDPRHGLIGEAQAVKRPHPIREV